MATREFVVVELAEPPVERLTTFQQLAAETGADGPPLKRMALDEKEEREIMAGDRYVAHAPHIPLQAIPDATPASEAPASMQAWGLEAIGVTATSRGSGVKVAILDSGIDPAHPAFAAMGSRLVVQDFTGCGAGDPCGHGTHCAGTLFGGAVNGTRIGVAPEVERAYVGRVLDGAGRGSSLALFEGMQWALAKANVLSMSLGFDFPGLVESWTQQGLPVTVAAGRALADFLANMRVFDTLVKLARDLTPTTGGCVVVAAAGNESTRAYKLPLAQPASADGVISVGAAVSSQEGLRIAPFSNTGPTVCAPGVDIISAVPGGLGVKSGTSMATPHVAGVAALWFEALRAAGELAVAGTVTGELTTRASRQGFAPNTPIVDRGRGLVRAP